MGGKVEEAHDANTVHSMSEVIHICRCLDNKVICCHGNNKGMHTLTEVYFLSSECRCYRQVR